VSQDRSAAAGFGSHLALNRAVVLRFRLYLESLGLAAGTINQRLAAVKRLAYEAADSGLLSPELAAGIRRACYHQLKCESMKRRRDQPLYFSSVMVDSNHFTNARALALVSLPEG
jgi:hypothetical protein